MGKAMETRKNETGPAGGTPPALVLQPVGIVRNRINKPFLVAGVDGLKLRESLEKVHEEVRRLERNVSTIVINEDIVDILADIETYSHLLVLYWAHETTEESRALKQVHPMGRKEIPKTGIFCTCSPARPNPVLVCVVRLIRKSGNLLYVYDLDAIDGSPVIDIKPYVKEWYPKEDVMIPLWMHQLVMKVDATDIEDKVPSVDEQHHPK
jgi:tRNA-Thr(GGU) m(6)t(6)A37 methyltransferase TsaA